MGSDGPYCSSTIRPPELLRECSKSSCSHYQPPTVSTPFFRTRYCTQVTPCPCAVDRIHYSISQTTPHECREERHTVTMRTAASFLRLSRPLVYNQSTSPAVHLLPSARCCRRWYWPSPTSMSGAVPPSTNTTAPPNHVFHLLLIRHAESYNNVLAEQLQHQHGDTPYNPYAARELVLAYDKARKVDPDLSQLGMKQANLLPEHPHLMDCRWYELAREGRLRVVSSPMLRTVQTSFPLVRQINQIQQNYTAATPRTAAHSTQYLITTASANSLTLPSQQLLASVSPLSLPQPLPYRAWIHPDFCERGGFYSTVVDDAGVARNVRNRGMTRSQLEAAYGNSHMADRCKEDGWWNQDAEGEEQEDEYFPRVERAITYTLSQAALYHQHHHTARQPNSASTHRDNGSGESHSADYMAVVSHADFIDSFLTRILQVHNHGRPKHCFYASNTSVSHVEISYSPLHHDKRAGVGGGGSGSVQLPKEGAVLSDVLRDYEVRIRCVNSLPRQVPAGNPPADDTVKEPENNNNNSVQ